MMQEPNAYSRRLFLQQGLTLASTLGTVPLFVERSAHGVANPLGSALSSRPGVPEDRILVVVQLGGGNDGLNTVVPYFDDHYHRARPRIGMKAPGTPQAGNRQALQLDEDLGLGLHPQLGGLKSLYDEGQLAIIQGVGYPNPNRSHFTSMDIWQTGQTDGKGNGWLGRYFDHNCSGSPDPQAAVTIGRNAPLALIGNKQKPVTFESEKFFRWTGQDLHQTLDAPYEEIVRRGTSEDVAADSQLGYLLRTSLDAQVSSDQIRTAVQKKSLVSYANHSLARQLKLIGSMIRGELSTRVYYASLGGFDTHGNQLGSHAARLREVSTALKSFQADLAAQGNADRVVTMVFSEFGRRVAENGSTGTDHGTAAPMFLMGSQVQSGIWGNHPSLTNLDAGDLRYEIDFRSIYAGILKDWMKTDPSVILNGDFRPAKVVKT